VCSHRLPGAKSRRQPAFAPADSSRTHPEHNRRRTTIITTATAVSPRVNEEHIVHPVQFSHLVPDVPADQQRFAHAEHDSASPVLFRVPEQARR
jgi:hypothetical protein